MKTNRQWALVLGLSMTMLLPFSLKAEEKGGGACKDDVQKFCKDVQPGGGRIIKCLKEHESELSEGCKQQQAAKKEARKEKREEIKAACKDDVQKFCKDVKPGDGRIINCLKQNESSLSSACQGELPKKKS